jgi:hypothetical protein
MLCKKAKQTGKPCGGKYSREIICEHSVTKCLRDCTPSKCRHFEGTSVDSSSAYGSVKHSVGGMNDYVTGFKNGVPVIDL